MYKYFGLNIDEQTIIYDNIPKSLKELFTKNDDLWNLISDIKLDNNLTTLNIIIKKLPDIYEDIKNINTDNIIYIIKNILKKYPELLDIITDITFKDGTTVHQKNGLFHNHDDITVTKYINDRLFSCYAIKINDIHEDVKKDEEYKKKYYYTSMSFNNGLLQSIKPLREDLLKIKYPGYRDSKYVRLSGKYLPSIIMQNNNLKQNVHDMTFYWHKNGETYSYDKMPVYLKQTKCINTNDKICIKNMKYKLNNQEILHEFFPLCVNNSYDKYDYIDILIDIDIIDSWGGSIHINRLLCRKEIVDENDITYIKINKRIKLNDNKYCAYDLDNNKYIIYEDSGHDDNFYNYTIEQYYFKDNIHKTDGPAYILKSHNKSIEAYYINGKLHRINGPAYITKINNKITEQYFIDGEEVEDVSKYNKYINKSSEIISNLHNGLLATEYMIKWNPEIYKKNLINQLKKEGNIKYSISDFFKYHIFGDDNHADVYKPNFRFYDPDRNKLYLFFQIENMYKFEFAIYKLLISKILKGDRKDINETIKKICYGNITRDCINYNRNKKHHYVTTQLQKDLQDFKDILSVDDINELWLEINLLENKAIELREKLNVYTDDCSICIDTTNSDDKILTKCGHWFHRKCINKITNNLCPNCKTKLDEKFENKYNINYGDYNENNIDNYNIEKEDFKTNCDDIKKLNDCYEKDIYDDEIGEYSDKFKEILNNYINDGWNDKETLLSRYAVNKRDFKYLEDNIDIVNFHELSANEYAIPFIQKHIDKVKWWSLNESAKTKEQFDFIEDNIDKVEWNLFKNKYAIPLLKKHIDKVDWEVLCKFAKTKEQFEFIEDNIDIIDKDNWLKLLQNNNKKAEELYNKYPEKHKKQDSPTSPRYSPTSPRYSPTSSPRNIQTSPR